MQEIKYIYFEINEKTGRLSEESRIDNENVLLIKPNTNSSGFWSFTNVTEDKYHRESTFTIVNQYWIDLDKYKSIPQSNDKLSLQVDEVLKKLNKKL